MSLQCLKGFASGMMEFGEPKKEYLKATSYCLSSGMSFNEKTECFESIIDYASFSYPQERLMSACDMIRDEYKSERVKTNCSKVR